MNINRGANTITNSTSNFSQSRATEGLTNQFRTISNPSSTSQSQYTAMSTATEAYKERMLELKCNKFYYSFIHDLVFYCVSFTMLVVFIYFKVNLLILALLVPFMEIKSVRDMRKRKRRIRQSAFGGDSHSEVMRYFRLCFKVLSLAGYVWGIVVNNSSIMALSLVPLAAIYAILFLMTILSDEIDHIVHLCIKAVKFTRISLTVQAIVILSKPTPDNKDPTKVSWPVFVHMILALPTCLIVFIYTVYFYFCACLNKENYTLLKKIIWGNVFVLTMLFSSNVVLIIGFIFLMEDYLEPAKNTKFLGFVLGCVLFYFLMVIISIPLKQQIMEQLKQRAEYDAKKDGGQNRVGPTAQTVPVGGTGINTIDEEEPSKDDQKSKSGKQNAKSEYSFHYVAKKNSTNFKNIKAQDLEKYSELGHSILNTPKITRKKPKAKRNRLDQRLPKIDQSVKDSFFDNLENLSVFTKKQAQTPKIMGNREFSNTPDYKNFRRSGTSNFYKMSLNRQSQDSRIQALQKSGNYTPVNRSVTPGTADLIYNMRKKEMLEKDLDQRFNLGQIKEDHREHQDFPTHEEIMDKKRRGEKKSKSNKKKSRKKEGSDGLESADDQVVINWIANSVDEVDSWDDDNMGENPIPKSKRNDKKKRSKGKKKSKKKKDGKKREDGKDKKEEEKEVLDPEKEKEKRQKRLETLMKKPKHEIETENETCFICMDNKPDSIFHPCGHGGFCFSCATSIVENNAICHYCRGDIAKVLRIDITKKYKDIYKILEVFRVTSVASSEEYEDGVYQME